MGLLAWAMVIVLSSFASPIASADPSDSSTPDPAVDAAAGALPAMGQVSATVRSRMAMLSWADVPGATQYVVELATRPDLSDAQQRVVLAGDLAVLTDLEPDMAYFVRVAPVTAAGQGAWSGQVLLTTPADPLPFTPPDIETVNPSFNSLEVTWSAPAASLRYELRYATVASMAKAKRVVVKQAQASLTGLAPDTTYYLRVRVVTGKRAAASDWSVTTRTATTSAAPLTVGSFNIRNAALDDNRPGETPWSKRRTAVADTILGQAPAVVGLQEASRSNLPGRKTSQMKDLVALLGKNWRLTNDSAKKGSEGTRIIYDTTKVKLVSTGFKKLDGSHKFGSWRYVAWAVFQQKSSGKKFFFANTHLVALDGKDAYNARKAEAEQVVRVVKHENRKNLPTFIVGDFNSSKFRKPDNAPYDVITAAGYVDPLDNTDRYTGAPRGIAEKRINAQLFSYNDFALVAKRGNYSTGVLVDQIFVTQMRVAEWETVARVNDAGRFVGVIPSDHNMIRATVYLP